ncbi:MAG: hypothetical protein U5R30_14845 [Deltaproteobacteria bacterium]|nr:hypothetical protein [Deltaproteobacteria bacterium]
MLETRKVFTVVDKDTHIIYSGKVPDIDHRIPEPDALKKSVKREALPDQILGGYVNLDVVKVVRMPKKTGKYVLYATISSFKSNVLEFEVYSKSKLTKKRSPNSIGGTQAPRTKLRAAGAPQPRSPGLSAGGTAPPDDRLLVRPKGRANQRIDADLLRRPVIRRGR